MSKLARGDDPRYLAALATCDDAQAALDATHLLDEDDPERLAACADTYQRRAHAWDQLAEALPRGVPPVFVTALFLASMSDADSARNYPRVGGRAWVG